jgi:hypothetical protein
LPAANFASFDLNFSAPTSLLCQGNSILPAFKDPVNRPRGLVQQGRIMQYFYSDLGASGCHASGAGFSGFRQGRLWRPRSLPSAQAASRLPRFGNGTVPWDSPVPPIPCAGESLRLSPFKNGLPAIFEQTSIAGIHAGRLSPFGLGKAALFSAESAVIFRKESPHFKEN